jgi:hypothetical protein
MAARVSLVTEHIVQLCMELVCKRDLVDLSSTTVSAHVIDPELALWAAPLPSPHLSVILLSYCPNWCLHSACVPVLCSDWVSLLLPFASAV